MTACQDDVGRVRLDEELEVRLARDERFRKLERPFDERAPAAERAVAREPLRPAGRRVRPRPLGQLLRMSVTRMEVAHIVARLSQRPHEGFPFIDPANRVCHDVDARVVAEDPELERLVALVRGRDHDRVAARGERFEHA